MRQQQPVSTEAAPTGHPGQDHGRRFPADQKLRRQGFRIWARPAGREPIWERDGVLYAESAALETVRRG